MSVVASCLDFGELFLFTNVYSPTDLLGKSLLWSHIRCVCSLVPFLPWILVGDFNFMLSLEEKGEELLG